MTRSSTRVALIERPINQPVEKHRRSARKHHANNHQEQNSPRGPPVRSHDQCPESKGQCKNRVRKTDQPKKPSDLSAPNASHSWQKTFTEANEENEVFRILLRQQREETSTAVLETVVRCYSCASSGIIRGHLRRKRIQARDRRNEARPNLVVTRRVWSG